MVAHTHPPYTYANKGFMAEWKIQIRIDLIFYSGDLSSFIVICRIRNRNPYIRNGIHWTLLWNPFECGLCDMTLHPNSIYSFLWFSRYPSVPAPKSLQTFTTRQGICQWITNIGKRRFRSQISLITFRGKIPLSAGLLTQLVSIRWWIWGFPLLAIKLCGWLCHPRDFQATDLI